MPLSTPENRRTSSHFLYQLGTKSETMVVYGSFKSETMLEGSFTHTQVSFVQVSFKPTPASIVIFHESAALEVPGTTGARTDWSGGSSNMQKHAKARVGDIRTGVRAKSTTTTKNHPGQAAQGPRPGFVGGLIHPKRFVCLVV